MGVGNDTFRNKNGVGVGVGGGGGGVVGVGVAGAVVVADVVAVEVVVEFMNSKSGYNFLSSPTGRCASSGHKPQTRKPNTKAPNLQALPNPDPNSETPETLRSQAMNSTLAPPHRLKSHVSRDTKHSDFAMCVHLKGNTKAQEP